MNMYKEYAALSFVQFGHRRTKCSRYANMRTSMVGTRFYRKRQSFDSVPVKFLSDNEFF